jgi:hypothetical protein
MFGGILGFASGSLDLRSEVQSFHDKLPLIARFGRSRLLTKFAGWVFIGNKQLTTLRPSLGSDRIG